MRWTARWALGTLATTACWLSAVRPADAQRAPATDFMVTARLPSDRLRETSGVAVSRQHEGLLWTHNDSGDGPLLYATDLEGHDLGAYRLADARAVDWEDIALGPCPATDGDCLFIGDTGDNAERRRRAAIYVLPEPPPPPSGAVTSLPARRLVVRYSDGAKDVEALAVDAQGTILLVSKGRSGPVALYRISRSDARRAEIVVDPSEELSIDSRGSLANSVTGAAISPDGSLLVVRTYVELFFYAWTEGRAQRIDPSCWLGPREPQGEAVDFLNSTTLVLTSEAQFGMRATIATVHCPDSLAKP